MAIITISQGTYSGGLALARCLSRELNYRLLSRETLLAEVATRFGLSAAEFEAALAFNPRFLENSAKRHRYANFVQTTLADQVDSDNVVYHGQAGHLMLRGIPHHLRLKVVSDLKSRVKAVMDQCDRKDPLKYIEDVDERRDIWVRRMHGTDRNDLAFYDLVVNLEQIGIEDTCAIVSEIVRRGLRTTPESVHKWQATAE